MLKMISWSEFLTTMLILSIIYWIVIVIKFYKWDLLALAQGKVNKENGEVKEEKQEMFKATDKAITHLTASFAEMKGQGLSKDDVVTKVKTILSKYGYLKGTPYAVAVNHFIIREVSNTMPLSEQEVKDLWE